jgi:dTDP-4-dehydrorhamnose reductase
MVPGAGKFGQRLCTCSLHRVANVRTCQNIDRMYQVASSPISKYDLLKLIAEVYGKSIRIVPDTDVVDDKRLDGTKFHLATGYTAPAWPELVTLMHESHIAFEKELK